MEERTLRKEFLEEQLVHLIDKKYDLLSLGKVTIEQLDELTKRIELIREEIESIKSPRVTL